MRLTLKRLLRACAPAFAAAPVLLSDFAAACPACAASAAESSGTDTLWLVVLTLSPLAIGAGLVWVLRRAGQGPER